MAEKISLRRKPSLQKEVWGWGKVKKQATQPETIKPVNRRARRAIKSGRKKKGIV